MAPCFATVYSQATSADDKPAASQVASSNATSPAAAAAGAAAGEQTAGGLSSEFSPQLTTKILELLCDESVSQLILITHFVVIFIHHEW